MRYPAILHLPKKLCPALDGKGILSPPKTFGDNTATYKTYEKMKQIRPDLSRATANAMFGVGMSPYRLIPNDTQKPSATSKFFKPLNQQVKGDRLFAGNSSVNEANTHLPQNRGISQHTPQNEYDRFSSDLHHPDLYGTDYADIDLDSGESLSTPPSSPSSSDRRLKENFETMDDALDKVCAMEGVCYNFKTSPNDKRSGLIAQDLENICPELVNHDDSDMLSINYIDIIPYLIESIKELKEKLDSK
jgi:hypothetical protein